MNNENISLSKNQSEELKKESRCDRRAEREMQRLIGQPFTDKVIDSLEKQRRKRWKDCKIYTQKYVAEKAGISLSTYKGYLRDRSYDIDLITVKNIADMLGCKLSDVIKSTEK